MLHLGLNKSCSASKKVLQIDMVPWRNWNYSSGLGSAPVFKLTLKGFILNRRDRLKEGFDQSVDHTRGP